MPRPAGAGRFPTAELAGALAEVLLTRFRAGREGFRWLDAPVKAPAAELAGLPDRSWRVLGQEIQALHEAYTEGGVSFAQAANPIHRRHAGYLAYFLPRNVYRVFHVLDGLPWLGGDGRAAVQAWCPPGGSRPTLRALDLGCGPGAFGLALLAWLARLPAGLAAPPRIELVLVDQGRQVLALAEANLWAFARRALPGWELALEPHAEGAEAYLASDAPGGFALVGLAFVLNELKLLAPGRSDKRARRVMEPLAGLLREGGLLALVEPGTRKGYMHLMAARDALLPRPILYPCPHGGPCPLWEPRVSQWCHATVAMPRGFCFDDLLRARAGVTFRMRDLNLAGLAVQNVRGGSPLAPFVARPGSRIVSAPMASREAAGEPQRGGRPAPKSQPRASRAASAGAPAPAPVPPPPERPRIVLACTPAGALAERPAAPYGPFPRGVWSAEG
ncbi:MAG: hypothetical protein HY423_15595 [Candidatus Lambdaproteobacteria bacterium]|nr:hypothetical protein [Candidatus Lambdaproteobacteria bacterium]